MSKIDTPINMDLGNVDVEMIDIAYKVNGLWKWGVGVITYEPKEQIKRLAKVISDSGKPMTGTSSSVLEAIFLEDIISVNVFRFRGDIFNLAQRIIIKGSFDIIDLNNLIEREKTDLWIYGDLESLGASDTPINELRVPPTTERINATNQTNIIGLQQLMNNGCKVRMISTQ